MIPLSLLLVLASLGLLVAGLVGNNQALVWASVIASTAACGCLLVSVLRRRESPGAAADADAPRAQPLDVGSRSFDPAVPTPYLGQPPSGPDSAPPAGAPYGRSTTGTPPPAPLGLPGQPGTAPTPPTGTPAAAAPSATAPTTGTPAVAPPAGTPPTGPPPPTAPAAGAPLATTPPADTPPATWPYQPESATTPGAGTLPAAPPSQRAPVDEAAALPPGLEDEPAVEDIPVSDALRVAQFSDEVLVVDGRPRYHLAGCPRLADRVTVPLAVSSARRAGFTPCAVCRPDATLLARSRSSSGRTGG